MKNLFVIILLLITSKVFSQTNHVMIEEKSSDWIKINLTVAKPKTIVKKKVNAQKPSEPKPDAKNEFEKTNQEVNRFRKKNG